MDDNQRRDQGTAKRRKVLGNAWVDKSAASKNAFNADFLDLITRYAWGEIWTRPHFDERTRRVLVIGTMVALGQWDEFRLHVRAALSEGGFTPDDIKEILLQQAIYCGVPAANHAVKKPPAWFRNWGCSTNSCDAAALRPLPHWMAQLPDRYRRSARIAAPINSSDSLA